MNLLHQNYAEAKTILKYHEELIAEAKRAIYYFGNEFYKKDKFWNEGIKIDFVALISEYLSLTEFVWQNEKDNSFSTTLLVKDWFVLHIANSFNLDYEEIFKAINSDNVKYTNMVFLVFGEDFGFYEVCEVENEARNMNKN